MRLLPSQLWPSLLLAAWLPHAAAVELPLAGARYNIPVSNLKQLRFAATVRQQTDFSCGSAALATLLTHHYNTPVDEQRVFEQMYLHGDQNKIRKEGFSMLDMQRYLAANGFRADGFRLPLHKLIDARLPAIVLVADRGYHHFVVIKGVAQGRILLGDPSRGARAVSLAAFEAMWIGKLLFVIHDTPAAPRFNTQADWRAAPAAPLASGIERNALLPLAMPKLGPADF